MKKLAILFGGISTEHDVSIVSGLSVLKNVNRKKYEVYPIYIDCIGNFYIYNEENNLNKISVGHKVDNIEKIDNIIEYLSNIDVIFPVLHGSYGEDGAIQGLLECINKPYVGCNIFASSVCMDKLYAKVIFERAGIKQSKYEYIKKYNNSYIFVDKYFNETIMDLEEVIKILEKNLKYPMFVKPANSGSSVGISKVKEKDELRKGIEYASEFDRKIIIEEGIVGKEVECAVLGNEDVEASCLGQIIPPEDDFYSYEAKYKNDKAKLVIPLKINIEEEVRKTAIKAFKAVDGKGLSRVDFFVTDNDEIYINEINTMPGFTDISMYSKLWDESGIKYSDLIDKLIDLAFECNKK